MRFSIPLLLTCVGLLGVTHSLQGQTMRELEEKKRRAMERIESTMRLRDEAGKQQKRSTQKLDLIKSQIENRNALINNTIQRIALQEEEIRKRNKAIEEKQRELSELKHVYAQFLKGLQFKTSGRNIVFTLLASENASQLYRRVRFYREYVNYQGDQFQIITSKEAALHVEKDSLLAVQKRLISLRDEETVGKRKLELEQEDYNRELKQLVAHERDLRGSLQAEQKNIQAINKAIAQLLKEEAAQNQKKVRSAQYKRLSKNFEDNKGRLPWPVLQGTISRGYGKIESKLFKGVSTQSQGVDITTTKGASVQAVFAGAVTKIAKIPGGQHIVIVRHGDFLTLYSNISDVFVRTGENVAANDALGRVHSAEGESHSVLHFEIWKGFSSQDPSKWLIQ